MSSEEMIVDTMSQGQQNSTNEQGTSQEEEGHYEVETLSKVRRAAKHPSKANAFQYEILVHWKGYDDITWEPLENLMDDVPDMVEDFLFDRWRVQVDHLTPHKWRGETYWVVPKPGEVKPVETKINVPVTNVPVTNVPVTNVPVNNVPVSSSVVAKPERKSMGRQGAAQNQPTMYPCSHCSKEFTMEHNMKRHERMVHSSKSQRRSESRPRTGKDAARKQAIKQELKRKSRKEVEEEHMQSDLEEEGSDQVDAQQQQPEEDEDANIHDAAEQEKQPDSPEAASGSAQSTTAMEESPQKKEPVVGSNAVCNEQGLQEMCSQKDSKTRQSKLRKSSAPNPASKIEQAETGKPQFGCMPQEMCFQQAELARIQGERASGKTEYIGCIFVNVPDRIIGVCQNQLQEVLYLVTYKSTESEVYLPTWCQDWLVRQIKADLISDYKKAMGSGQH